MSVEEHVIPIVEERVRVDKRLRVRARLRLRIRRDDTREIVRLDLRKQTVSVTRTPRNIALDVFPSPRVEGATLIVPIVEERLVVQRKLFLVEELRLELHLRQEPVEAPVVLRRIRADVLRTEDEETVMDRMTTDRTITAFFRNRNDAEKAGRELTAIGVSDVEIHAEDGGHKHNGGLFGFLGKLFIPDDDKRAYGEGLRRGNALMTVRLDETQADAAIDVLERSDALDLEASEAEWRNEISGSAAQTFSDGDSSIGATSVTSDDATLRTSDTTLRTDDASFGERRRGDETVIPVVEEQLRVGKREVGRGGVRVRSYIIETPVEEQVSLRREHVEIERRPATHQSADAQNLLQEGDIELMETEEVAVVAKEAVVTEEVVVRREAEERVETVRDTVRRTEVDVEDTRDKR